MSRAAAVRPLCPAMQPSRVTGRCLDGSSVLRLPHTSLGLLLTKPLMETTGHGLVAHPPNMTSCILGLAGLSRGVFPHETCSNCPVPTMSPSIEHISDTPLVETHPVQSKSHWSLGMDVLPCVTRTPLGRSNH